MHWKRLGMFDRLVLNRDEVLSSKRRHCFVLKLLFVTSTNYVENKGAITQEFSKKIIRIRA